MNPTENTSELDQLKKQIAELRQELNDLTQHFGIDKFEDGSKSINIHCTALCLLNPEKPHEIQGTISGGPDGPEICLWGSADKTRLSVRVDKDGVPSIQLFQPEQKLAVHIGHDKLGMPSVGVFEQGQPRAAMKASEQCGIISAVHNGGQPRVTMSSQEGSGEIMLLNPDMKVAVKLSTQGQHDEGFITVNHSNGKAAVILSALPEHGCVLLNDRAGQLKYSLPDPRNI